MFKLKVNKNEISYKEPLSEDRLRWVGEMRGPGGPGLVVMLVYPPSLTYLVLEICPTLSEYPIYFHILKL